MSGPIPAGGPRRAIVLSHKTLVGYSRTERFARTLRDAGWQVTIAGLAGDGLPEREIVDGIELIRAAPRGRLISFMHDRRGRLGRGLRRLHLPTPSAVAQVAAWPLAARAWANGLHDLPPADLYHACGLGAAVAAHQLASAARRSGRRGAVVYDLIDIFLEANRYPTLPGWRRSLYRRREAGLVHVADLLTTVNDALADDAVMRWRLAERPLVIFNAPARAELPQGDTDLVRRAAGLPATTRVVAFLGRFVPGRGILEAGDAVMRVADAAFVAIGYGPLEGELRARDAERPGRHVTLPAVPPTEVARWAAGADATVFTSPDSTLNLRLSTPNKLWESLAGGAPVVYGAGLAGVEAVLAPERLGIAVAPDDPVAIAAALRTLLDAPPAERAARRARARTLAAERYAWDIRMPEYLALVDRRVPRS